MSEESGELTITANCPPPSLALGAGEFSQAFGDEQGNDQ
jgi:hypothetical protein